MADIIKLLLSVCLLFIVTQSVPADLRDKCQDIENKTDIKNCLNNLTSTIIALEQKVTNLSNIVNNLEAQDLDDLINTRIENVTASLEEQIYSLWIKLNQSTSSTILPNSTVATPMSSSNVISTSLPSQTPTLISSITSSSSNAVPTTSPTSNAINVSPRSSNTLLGIVISIFAILIIGLLLYVAYQYRYQVYKLIIMCFVNDDLSLDTYLDFVKGRASSMCFFG